MPRTKNIRKTKRNRIADDRDKVIRESESILEHFVKTFEWKIKQKKEEIDTEIDLLKTRIPQKMLVMKMGDLMNLRSGTFSDIETKISKIRVQRSRRNLNQSFKRSRDDEGYHTEDSRERAKIETVANLPHSRVFANIHRNPGPLRTGKDSRRRRSRSAGGNIIRAKAASNDEHISRRMMRSPLLIRQIAFSADRITSRSKDVPNSPTALLRWPKPGELVVSVTGSPVVAHVMPNSFANVNIPVKDGVLSLRPKKLQSLDPELVHRIDQETLNQIKLLQSNLELIMSFADKK